MLQLLPLAQVKMQHSLKRSKLLYPQKDDARLVLMPGWCPEECEIVRMKMSSVLCAAFTRYLRAAAVWCESSRVHQQALVAVGILLENFGEHFIHNTLDLDHVTIEREILMPASQSLAHSRYVLTRKLK